VSFRLRSHTADVAVEATADTLGGVMAAVGDGMAAAMRETVPEEGGRHPLTVSAEGPEPLLFDYLDELIYERDVRSVLPVDNQATVTEEPGDGGRGGDSDGGWSITASYRGVPLAGLDARDLKAVTYSEMELAETDGTWRAYVVFDV